MKPPHSSNPLPLATTAAIEWIHRHVNRTKSAQRELAVSAAMFIGGKMKEMEVMMVQDAWGREGERKYGNPFLILEMIYFGQNYSQNFSSVFIISCELGQKNEL